MLIVAQKLTKFGENVTQICAVLGNLWQILGEIQSGRQLSSAPSSSAASSSAASSSAGPAPDAPAAAAESGHARLSVLTGARSPADGLHSLRAPHFRSLLFLFNERSKCEARIRKLDP